MQLSKLVIWATLACILCSLAFVESAQIDGRLLGVIYRGKVTRGVSPKSRVFLNNGEYSTQIDSDGSFAFAEVPEGTYLLEVQSPYLVYSKVRLIVTMNDIIAYKVSLGDHFLGQLQMMPLPLVLAPRPRPIHYVPPEGAKVAGWFANPMVLMSSFSLLMLLVMPRIMANLDSEALETLRASYDFSCLPSLGPSRHAGPSIPPIQYSSHYPHQPPYPHVSLPLSSNQARPLNQPVMHGLSVGQSDVSWGGPRMEEKGFPLGQFSSFGPSMHQPPPPPMPHPSTVQYHKQK